MFMHAYTYIHGDRLVQGPRSTGVSHCSVVILMCDVYLISSILKKKTIAFTLLCLFHALYYVCFMFIFQGS